MFNNEVLTKKQFSVLFVGSYGRYFVERVGDGPWTLPRINIFGARDTVMSSLASKASHIGLSCDVGKEITYFEEFTRRGSSHHLISIPVCCRRFWLRENSRMITFEEVTSAESNGGSIQFDSLISAAIAEWRRLFLVATPA